MSRRIPAFVVVCSCLSFSKGICVCLCRHPERSAQREVEGPRGIRHPHNRPNLPATATQRTTDNGQRTTDNPKSVILSEQRESKDLRLSPTHILSTPRSPKTLATQTNQTTSTPNLFAHPPLAICYALTSKEKSPACTGLLLLLICHSATGHQRKSSLSPLLRRI